ncbi:MAG: phosphodiester glycosidase family protein [Verrucomicrobiales bacterium]|nr:phosphodiester glycosidase family protein [Verrucomicrobiales bacterium]
MSPPDLPCLERRAADGSSAFRLSVQHFALLLLGVWAPFPVLGTDPDLSPPTFEYGLQVFEKPRPIRLHWIRVDLRSEVLQVMPIVAQDPDGAGPAEATLTQPETLMRRASALAAINANAFQVLPGSQLADGGWFENRPVIISGWVVERGQIRSPMDGPLEQLWVTTGGRPGFDASLPDPALVDWAVGTHAAKHGVILRNGVVEAEDTPFSTHLHPRTALGLDAEGARLWMVVVDGRTPGFSEGATLTELASFMKTLGCRHALNLDGGGSTVMMLADETGAPRVMNRPSSGTTRPVPVLLGICRKSAPARSTKD